MRVLVIVISICIFSCSSKKTVVDNSTSKETVTDSLVITKVPNVVEPPAPPSFPEPPAEIISNVEKVDSIPLPPKPPIESTNFKESMHNRWNTILNKYVSENGDFNYKSLKKERIEFDIYIDYLSETLPEESWSKNEILAYWINAYNALTVDLIIRNYPLKSIKDIKDPWDQRLWKFGDKWINLNDIEHQILRKMNEPRIHFAIVCASKSCPKLLNEAFLANKLEEQLTNATKEFLSDPTKNEISETKVKLSKIFKWFKKDFEQNGSLIDFLNQYAPFTISQDAKKSFKGYNWNLNE